MALNLDSISVESFATTAQVAQPITQPDTGRYGPHSYCWICENTDATVPSCGWDCATVVVVDAQ